MIQKSLIIVLMVLLCGRLMSQDHTDWKPIDSRPIPGWFEDAKFGIFIHWGLYSVPAWAPANADIDIYGKYAEWYWWSIMNPDDKAGSLFRQYHDRMYGAEFRYQEFAPMFKAEHFEPVQWADIFRRAGARYVVLTSKHHDGYTLWPSAQSWNWNSVDIGPRRDLCQEISHAVKNAGLHMGFYYSLYEWFNPLYRDNPEKYVDDHMLPQLKDLVMRYQPDIVWTDGEWDHTSDVWKSIEFLNWLYGESPVGEKVVVNDRWGRETRGKHGGYYTTEYDLVHDGKGLSSNNHPWEECRGIGTSFGYNRIETPEHYMSSTALIHLLIEKVSNGGNLLLNVGPTADGRIPAIQQQRLMDIGEWLAINGDAIYGTRSWDGKDKNKHLENVYFTRKGSDLYVICTRFPEKPITIYGANAGRATLLGRTSVVPTRSRGSQISIQTSGLQRINLSGQHAWVFKIENALE